MLFYLLAHDTSLCVRPRVRGRCSSRCSAEFRRVMCMCPGAGVAMQTHPGPGPRGHIVPPAARRQVPGLALIETAPCGSGAPGKSGRTEAEHGRRGAGRGTAAGMHSGLRSRRAIADCEFATSRGTRGGAYGERRDRPGTRKRNRTGRGRLGLNVNVFKHMYSRAL